MLTSAGRASTEMQKVPGKVRGKLFAGALWQLGARKLEVVVANDDGTVVCIDETGAEVSVSSKDLSAGKFLGDAYEDLEDVTESN